MRRISLILALLFAAPVFATTTVTGKMQNLGTGNVGQATFVRFWLRGCGGNQPRVNGTAIIAPTQGGVFYFDLTANSSGVISGTLYSTRASDGVSGGEIECGGSKTSVWYGMQAFVNGKGGPETPIHALNGITLDITSVTPISETPPVTSPTGDTTYLRLNGTNGPAQVPLNNQSQYQQVGADFYPGTGSGTCTVPAAPTVATETIISPTGNFDSGTTYYVEVTGFNRNGETTAGATTSYKPASGSTNSIYVQLSGYAYRSGCYGYRAYISSSGPSGPFYLAQAYQKTNVAISSWSRNAANIVTVTVGSNPGLVPGDYVTITGSCAGGGLTTITGSFSLIPQQGSTPTTFFFNQGSGGADSGTTGCTATAYAGLGADSYGHIAPGDFIISTVPTSGTQPPVSNTAAIDPIQVALNATCDYSTNTCANGQLIVPQGTTTVTTPLIISNQQTVSGVNAPTAYGKSQIGCSFAELNLACVMVMGTANGVRLEGTAIVASAGNALRLVGSGPGYGSFDDFIRNNYISTSDTSGTYSAIALTGTWYDEHWENNSLGGGLADIVMWAHNGGEWFFSGARWNVANLAGGLNSNAILSYSSVTDPDRAINRTSFPNGASQVYIFNNLTEGGTGIVYDMVNLGFAAKDLNASDGNPNTSTPAIIRVGVDANCGGCSVLGGISIKDSWFQDSANFNAGVLVASNASNGIPQIAFENAQLPNTNFINLNSVSVSVVFIGSTVHPYESATSGKIINRAASGNVPSAYGVPYDGTTQTGYAMHQFAGGIRVCNANSTSGCFYLYPPAGSPGLWSWYGGDPATAANLFAYWSFSSGGRFRLLKNDGSTLFAEFNASSGANQINLCSSSGTNSQVTIGCTMNSQTIIPSTDNTYALGNLSSPALGWGSLILSANGSETSLQGNASWAGISNNKNVFLPPGPSTIVGIPYAAGLDQTGVSTANSGSPQSILATVPVSGQYRVSIYVDQSAGCATVGSGALTVVLGWTDGTHARVSATLTLTPGTAATGTSSYVSATQFIWAAASSAITVTDTYTACSVGTWTYDQHATVERTE